MQTIDFGLIVLVGALLLAGIAVPLAVIAVHQYRRRHFERAAGRRRKKKIRL